MQLELAVFAMDGDEIARLDQVDDELEFFLAGVAADVDGWRASVFVDDVGFAAEEVIDHPVNSFFVARDDARGEDDGVALFDFGVLVVVDGGAGERGHGLALRATDEDADFFRRKIFHLAGIDDEALWDLDVAEIFGDLGGIVHGAAEEGDLAAMLVREFDRQIDAMDRGRKARDEQTALGVGENFVELASDSALAGCVSLALDVGGILKQGEDAAFAVFGKGMKVEEFVVGGRGIDFEIASVDDNAEGSMDREGHAIDQAMRDVNGMDGEGSGLEALVGAHFAQVSVVEQAVLVEFVFDIGKRELGAPHRNFKF